MNNRQQEHAQKRVQVVFDERDRNRDGKIDDDELVDYESEQSFPASDSPSWTLGTTESIR